ncbi:FAD dependent oxidoreductase [Trinorchestia longiramus]|nr:FAD dependent oxidoreductase [Trinorchestia longiramus]
MSDTAACDAAVVGGGVVGYCTGLELARHGFKTVLFEQFPSPHTRGSSTGQSRITRVANCQAPGMTEIMVDALEDWKNIEKEVKRQLLMWVKFTVNRKILKSTAGGEPDVITPRQLNQEHGYNFPDDVETFFDTKSAVMLADQCVLALKELFERSGGVVKDRWLVKSVQPQASGKLMLCGPEQQNVEASRVAICAGPWTGPLLQSLGLTLPLQPERVNVFYWKIKDEGRKGHVFVYKSDSDHDGVYYYGLPSVEYPGLVKLCRHGGVLCDPDERDREVTDHTLAHSQSFVEEYFPFLCSTPVVRETCMYTRSPDNEMILDILPGHQNIAFACGFSGMGFKIAPVVGRLLRQMLSGEKLDHNITSFSAARFST